MYKRPWMLKETNHTKGNKTRRGDLKDQFSVLLELSRHRLNMSRLEAKLLAYSLQCNSHNHTHTSTQEKYSSPSATITPKTEPNPPRTVNDPVWSAATPTPNPRTRRHAYADAKSLLAL